MLRRPRRDRRQRLRGVRASKSYELFPLPALTAGVPRVAWTLRIPPLRKRCVAERVCAPIADQSSERSEVLASSAMIAPPHLTTERLSLEPLTRRHSHGMFLLWSRREVCRYSGPAVDWAGEPIRLPAECPADSDKIIDFFEQMAAADRGFRWAVINRKSRVFAGAVGFNSLAPTAELAFHLRPEFWGRGIMREAAEGRWSGSASIDRAAQWRLSSSLATQRRSTLLSASASKPTAQRQARRHAWS